MTILVTGAGGQVGSELVHRAQHLNLAMRAFTSADLDICQAAAVNAALQDPRIDLVINAAAYTAVDRAEQEPKRAFAANRDGPKNLATACAQRAIPLLHISTDYVFDGQKSTPYCESDPASPLGVYGHSKWAGDQAVVAALPEHLILRVSWVFGRNGHNFVRTMLAWHASEMNYE